MFYLRGTPTESVDRGIRDRHKHAVTFYFSTGSLTYTAAEAINKSFIRLEIFKFLTEAIARALERPSGSCVYQDLEQTYVCFENEKELTSPWR